MGFHRRARVLFEALETRCAWVVLALPPDLVDAAGDGGAEIIEICRPAVIVIGQKKVVAIVQQDPLAEMNGREAEQLAPVQIANPPASEEQSVQQPEKASE